MNKHLSSSLDIALTVQVYLDWNDTETRWVISPLTMDGHPLDSMGGVSADLAELFQTKADKQALRAAKNHPAPTGAGLIPLLADQLPGEVMDPLLNAMIRARKAAEGDSSDEEIEALQEYISHLEGLLGFDSYREEII